ncbi:MAG: DUF1800 family protein [Gammaproteobacteria bacterium]|nr:DUF1800 family protein [Gammaproteobacteria bacterium]
MYTIKRYFVFILCLCMSSYSLPVFAYALDNEGEISKVELSDEAMGEIQGAGNIDATMLDYKVGGTQAQAIIVNRSGLNASYAMEVLDYNSNVLEILDEGMIGTGTLKMVTGTPTLPGTQNRIVRIRLQSTSGHVSVDTSIAVSSVDSDTDGISDWNEKKHGLNPYFADDALLDNDGDTLSNIDEINIHRTDPNKADTDGDGLADNLELQHDLNPLLASDATLDADSDYVTNIDEILIHNTNPYISDPGLAKDTDGDGILDLIEVTLGMDPNDVVSRTVGLDTSADKHIAHVLNRTTFGLTPELLESVKVDGLNVWLEGQLSGEDFVNDNAQVMRENSHPTFDEIEKVGAIRPVHSNKQLQARMGLFWDNHFSTSITETRWDSELHEEDLFFQNAFGNFRTLLGISAKSHAMLKYLDLLKSTAAGANENYAREVMELHTLGTTITDGDYSGVDIAELARIFTGWSVYLDTTEVSRYKSQRSENVLYDSLFYKFKFNASKHDVTAKTFLGETFPAGEGVAEGDRALDMLAVHPSTAKFICLKLARHFIEDNPNAGMLAECANVFMNNKDAPNQMGQVVRYLLDSEYFNFFNNQRSKFKDHQEYVFSLARLANWSAVGNLPATGGVIGKNVVGDIAEAMGQRQFAKEEPTGWEEDVAGGWLSANSALHRFREGNSMSLSGNTKLAEEFKAKGITSSKDVLANIFLMMLGGHYDQKHMLMGYGFLHPNNATFDLNTLSPYIADARIRLLISRLAQMPEFSAH